MFWQQYSGLHAWRLKWKTWPLAVVLSGKARKLEVSSETTMPPSTGQLEDYIGPPGNKIAPSYGRAQKEGQLNYLLFLSVQLTFQGQDGATNSLLYHLCREVWITESTTTSTLVPKPLAAYSIKGQFHHFPVSQAGTREGLGEREGEDTNNKIRGQRASWHRTPMKYRT